MSNEELDSDEPRRVISEDSSAAALPTQSLSSSSPPSPYSRSRGWAWRVTGLLGAVVSSGACLLLARWAPPEVLAENFKWLLLATAGPPVAALLPVSVLHRAVDKLPGKG